MSRDAILEAAAQVFSQKGFHGASMQDIAAAVNLQKASLYHHIHSKQELLVMVLDQALDMLIEHIEEIVHLPLAPDEKLRQAMRVYLQDLLEHRDLAAVLLLEHRSLEPDLQTRHIPRRDRFERLWRDLIQEGLDQGNFCCIDPATASRALLGTLNWTITWYLPEGKLLPVEIAEQFAELYLAGLLIRRRDA
jgi:AcrR family transcriptional regulator